MIADVEVKESATIIGCDSATIRAVIEVESSGKGIINGQPLILFEPHCFWKQLKQIGIDPVAILKSQPSLKDILYPIWGTGKYGKTSEQHSRLERASKINRDAALKSASWGLFQIMGYNFSRTGVCDLQAFINKNYESESEQLKLFLNYIKNAGLDDELKAKDWKGFAYQYNGSGYRKNNYDLKLKNAYNKYKQAGI